MDGFANLHRYLVWTGDFLPTLFQFEQTVDSHRDHRDSQVIYQQADSRAEGADRAVGSVTPFRKYEDVVTTIHRLSRKSKALAKPGLPGKRKKIQERDSQYPFNPVEDSAKEIPFSRRIPQRFESFASGRCRGATINNGQRSESK